MAPGAAIEVHGLRKSFGRTAVLNGLDLTVQTGEVHAFLGPNASGKTTTLRLLLGLLRADAGTMSVLGLDPWTDSAAVHRRLAYVPGDVALWPNLTGGEVIDLLGRLRGGADRARRDALVERFDLDPTRRARSYSKGNRQKVALIAALSADVELYLLDEPTSGLDPLMEAEFRECVRELRSQGRTILLSSHILSEAEALSDRVSVLRRGVVVETGTLDQLRLRARSTVTARVARMPGGLGAIPGVEVLSAMDGELSARVEPDAMDAVLTALAGSGVTSLVSAPPTLEELFLRLYGNEDGGDDGEAAQ